MRRSAASHKKKGGAARGGAGGAQRGVARTPAAAPAAAASAASAPSHSYFPANSEAAEKRRAAHRQQQQYQQQQSQHGGSRSRRQSVAAVSFGDPFASIRSRSDSKESHMIQANIVLAAIADLLKEQGVGGEEHQAPEPTPTHYFGMLMVLLEQRASQTQESLGAIMYLLSVLLPQLPRAVLKSKVEATATVLISLLESYADDALLAKHVLECATTLLLATAVDQPTMWTTAATTAGNKSVTKLLQVLLVYSLDHRPRVRKAGQEGVKETLKAMYEHSIVAAQSASASTPARIGVPKSVSETMCNFSLREVSQCTPKDCQIVLFLCGLLQGCIQFLSLSSAARILEAILSLVGRGNSILMVQAMRTIDAFFVRASEIHLGMGKDDDEEEEDEEEEERAALPSSTDPKSRDKFLQLSSQLLSVLLSLKPHHNDQLATQAYLHTLQLGLTRFMSGVEGVGSNSSTQGQSGFVTVLQHAYEKVPELLGLISEGLLSPKPDVVKASTKAMTNILKQTITAGMVRASMTEAERKAAVGAGAGALPPFYRVLELMESLLGYRYKVEWNRILLLISHLFHATAAVGRDAQQLLLPILRKMDMMHNEASTESFGEDPSKDYRPALDEAMGAAIQTMGPEAILTVLPLNLPLDFYAQQQGMDEEDMDTSVPLHEQLSSSRAWLLPLFRAYLPHSPHAPLAFFLDFFFPIAMSLHELEKVALTPSPTRPSGSAVEAKAFHSLKLSIWDLLPSIASSLPSDLSTSFKRVVKSLVTSVLQVDEMSFAHANVCKGVANTIRRLKDIVAADQEAQAAQGSNKATDEDEEEAKAAFDDEEDSDEEEDDDADSDDESALAKAKAKRAAKAAQQKKAAAAASSASSSRRRSGAYTASEAQTLLSSTISPLSKHLLPVLFNLALMPAAPGNSLAQQRREAVFDAVTLVASVSEEALLNQTIKKVLKKLLEHTTALTAKKQQAEAPSQPTQQEVQRTHLLMDLVGALCAQSCSTLHADSVQYLYTILKSQMTEGAEQGTAVDAGLQKKCYKILSTLLSQHTAFFKEQWKVVVQDLIAASPSLHPSALKARLGCLRPILVHAGQGILKDKATTAAILPVFLGEVMLGTKDASVRTRDEAFNVLVEVGLAMYKMQEEKRMALGMGASVQDLFGGLSQPTSAAPVMSEYIYMVAAGLAGSSPHMQSASVLCLARMVYEFRGNKSNLELQGLPPLDESLVVSLLHTLLPLFTSRSRELIKALLTFTKVSILTLSPSTLAQGELLDPLVAGLVSWCHEKKQRFKLKIKLLFELLMKKVGVEPVAELVPEQHAALIAHIRKTKEREKRQKTEAWKAHQRKKGAAVEGEDGVSHRTLQDYDSIMRDDDAEEGKGADATSKAAQSRLRKEAANQMYIRSADVDFLDPSVITKVSASDPRRDMATGRSIALGGGVSQDAATGKLLIADTKVSEDAKRAASMIDLDELEGEIKDKQREKRKRARDQMEDDEEEQGGSRAVKKQQLTPGHQFRSTKAGGDMKRRGQLNPYAFVPLDPQQMNKRKKFTAARRLESIVTAAKKGSQAGSSIAKKNHSRSHKNKVHHKKK